MDESLFYINTKHYQKVDLTKDYKELMQLIKEKIAFSGESKPFDLVQSLEVAEHLDAEFAQNFVSLLTSAADIVLFSAAIPYQPGTHHVNCQAPNYWADLFAQEDFICFDILRMDFWENENVEWWYKQNTMFFIHKSKAHIFENLGFKPSKPKYLISIGLYEEYALRALHSENLNFNLQSQLERIKKQLSYRLGSALVKNPLTFLFKIPKIYYKFRKEKL